MPGMLILAWPTLFIRRPTQKRCLLDTAINIQARLSSLTIKPQLFFLPQKVIGHAVFHIFGYFFCKDLFLEKVYTYNT
jgi:hypothetical protein